MWDVADPATVLALGAGLMTALLFVLAAQMVSSQAGRRLGGRLEATASRKRGAPPAAGTTHATRTLSRRESATPTMDRIVRRWLPQRESLSRRLGRTGRTITIGHYAVATLAAIVAMNSVSAALLGFGGASILVGFAGDIGVQHYLVGRMGNRRVAGFLMLFPEAIDLMVRALRSGLPISEAIINAGQEIGDPVGAEFRSVEAGMRLGRDLESLLWDIAKRIDAPEFRFFIIALGVQRETGGNLAETLANLSDLLRRRRAMRMKARAMSSEARASMMILGSLPVLVTLILLLTSPNYIGSLFTDTRGIVLCCIAVGMLGTGVFVMTRMAKFEI